MKFLSVCKPKDSLSLLPAAVARQLLEASFAAMKQQKKEGKILESYYSTARCIAVILEYKNIDEWVKDLIALPIMNYYDCEVYPLSDMEEAGKIIIESVKTAEKMSAPK